MLVWRTYSTIMAVVVVGTWLAVPATADAGTTIASGHIWVGGPHTAPVGSIAELAGEEGVDGFSFDVSSYAGVPVRTATADGAGVGYDVDLWFYDDEGNSIDVASRCATTAADEECVVPPQAVVGYVTASSGADLDVAVVTV